MENNDKKNILVCPLNWGKGHATRVQVIAGELVRRGYKVYIAAPHKYNKTFDRSAYTELVNIWSPSIYYSGFFPLFIDVFFQLPVHFIAFITDRLRLAGILRRYSIGLIISDNRFGFWSKRVYSIYITHQLRVALPRAFSFAGSFISSIHRFIVSRYDECWVPDLPGEDNLSGRLSHHCSQPSYTYYIGPLSRLFYHTPRWRGSPDPCRNGHAPFTLALLSGPEPQRSIFEKIIISQKSIFPGQLIIVAGRPEDDNQIADSDILRYPWLDSSSLSVLVMKAELIICRSGYSTIMDLCLAGSSALFIPTPGQPEQEYLAHYLADKYGCTIIKQKDLAHITELPAVKKEIKWPAAGRDMLDTVLNDVFKRIP